MIYLGLNFEKKEDKKKSIRYFNELSKLPNSKIPLKILDGQ